MKYIFFGTPRFAALILDALAEAGMPPFAVVTNPDRPSGRKKIITSPAAKIVAEKHGIAVLQPEKLDDAFITELKAAEPDFFVVAAYANIIPKSVLAIPPLGTLGTHPSLLPYYRGASPIQSVIMNGEKGTGSTIYHMDEQVDHGPIFTQESMPLDSLHTNYLTLEENLAKLSAKLLIKTMPAFFAKTLKSTPQKHNEATFTKKFVTNDGFVDEKDLEGAQTNDALKAETIIRKINALTPEPGVWTKKNGKRVKLLKAELAPDKKLILKEIQEEGGTPKRVG